jgi:hypothetical protein
MSRTWPLLREAKVTTSEPLTSLLRHSCEVAERSVCCSAAAPLGGRVARYAQHLAAAHRDQPVVGIPVDRRGLRVLLREARVLLREQEIRHDDGGHADQQAGGGPATAMTSAAPAVRGVVHRGEVLLARCSPEESWITAAGTGRLHPFVAAGSSQGCLEREPFRLTALETVWATNDPQVHDQGVRSFRTAVDRGCPLRASHQRAASRRGRSRSLVLRKRSPACCWV